MVAGLAYGGGIGIGHISNCTISTCLETNTANKETFSGECSGLVGAQFYVKHSGSP